MLGNFFQSLGSGLKQGFGNLKHLSEDGTDARTPPFLPEGGGVKPQIPISQPQIPARPNPPLSVSPFATEGAAPFGVKPPMAPPRELPSAEEIAPRAGGMGIIPRPALPPAAMPQGQPGNTAEALDRRGVPLPALPGQRNPTPYSDVNRERYDYNTAHMKRDENGDLTSKYRRDWKQVLGNMLMGGAQGAANVGPHGNALGGLIGGAGAGLAGSVLSPQGSTNYAFNTRYLPGIERQQAEAEQERAQEAARIKQQQDQLMGQAKLGKVIADTELSRANAKKAGQAPNPFMHNVPAGATAIDATGNKIFTNPANPRGPVRAGDGLLYDTATGQWISAPDEMRTQKPMTHTQAVDEQRAQDGSPEEIGTDSFNDPGFQQSLRDNFYATLTPIQKQHYDRLQTGYSDDELLAKMPASEQAILTGTAKNVSDVDADRAAAHLERLRREHEGGLEKVRTAWQEAQNKALNKSISYTRGVARAKAGEIRTGNARPQGSGPKTPSSGKAKPANTSGGTRNLSDLEQYLQ